MIAEWKQKLALAEQEYRHAERTVAEEEAALALLAEQATAASEAQKILQAAAQAVQQQAHAHVARIVTRCLKAVFGPGAYEFRINFLRKRGKTEANLVFVRDGKEIDPATAAGGGAVDIAALALRIACLMLATPRKRKVIFFDEPCRMLSVQYAERAKELLETISRELSIQLVVVTHQKALACGKIIEIT